MPRALPPRRARPSFQKPLWIRDWRETFSERAGSNHEKKSAFAGAYSPGRGQSIIRDKLMKVVTQLVWYGAHDDIPSQNLGADRLAPSEFAGHGAVSNRTRLVRRGSRISINRLVPILV